MGKKKFDKKSGASFKLVYSADPDAAPGERIFMRTDKGDDYVPGFSDDYTGPTPSQIGAGSEYNGDGLSEFGDEEPMFAGSVTGSRDKSVGRASERGGSRGGGSRSRSASAEPQGPESRGTSRSVSRSRSRVGSSSRPPSMWGWEDGGRLAPLPEDVRREIIDLGLEDDGYDYTQHLRVIGSKSRLGSFLATEQPKNLKPDVRVGWTAGFFTVRSTCYIVSDVWRACSCPHVN